MPPKRKATTTSSEPPSKKTKTQGPTKSPTKAPAKAPAKAKSPVKAPAKAPAKATAKGKKEDTSVPTPAGAAKAGTGTDLKLLSYLKAADWKTELADEFQKDYFKKLEVDLAKEYAAGKQIFPPKDLIFNAMNSTPLNKVKVVILGQDPYHDDGQAMGLSFSVPKGINPPPSLKNIYKELESDAGITGFKAPNHGCLDKWTTEGVLLLNATLTVEAHQPNSHAKMGWQKFTDHVIQVVSEKCTNVAFILWGGFAQKKEKLIDQKKHCVIKTAHPSPLSVKKFMGCKCFSLANNALKAKKLTAINWSL